LILKIAQFLFDIDRSSLSEKKTRRVTWVESRAMRLLKDLVRGLS